MSTVPITSAETVLVGAMIAALTPHVGVYANVPKAYYLVADQGAPMPFVVFQCQADIERTDMVGDIGAEVLVTLKAFDHDRAVAHSLLASAVAAFDTLAADDYTLTARYESSPTIPPRDAIWQAAHTYRVMIGRSA